ncbi:MAG TPA: HAD family hydrolase [Clostridiaceae bacterium]
MKIDGIIFDLDGTLWDSTQVVLKSWNRILEDREGIKNKLSKETMESVMGLQLPQIGAKLFPYLEVKDQMELMLACCTLECGLIKEEGGELFQGISDTLKKLFSRYPLFIVSNCQDGYIEAFFSYHKLDKYFIDYEHAGKTRLPKGENIKLIMERNGLTSPIYVGDTQGDLDGARLAAIPFVYAAYGFGKVQEYEYSIDSIQDLCKLFL